VFCTNALLLLKLLGKACGEEYVVVGRFSYAFRQMDPDKLPGEDGLTGSRLATSTGMTFNLILFILRQI
jgi:hypothetical protein